MFEIRIQNDQDVSTCMSLLTGDLTEICFLFVKFVFWSFGFVSDFVLRASDLAKSSEGKALQLQTVIVDYD